MIWKADSPYWDICAGTINIQLWENAMKVLGTAKGSSGKALELEIKDWGSSSGSSIMSFPTDMAKFKLKSDPWICRLSTWHNTWNCAPVVLVGKINMRIFHFNSSSLLCRIFSFLFQAVCMRLCRSPLLLSLEILLRTVQLFWIFDMQFLYRKSILPTLGK